MGELNTVPMRINRAEGAAGQVKISGGAGVLETWGAPAPAAHVHDAADVATGQIPLARLADAVCSETEADNKITDHAALPNIHHKELIFTELAGGEIHRAADALTWEDWDLSAIVGAGAKVVLVMIYRYGTTKYVGARENGSSLIRKGRTDEGTSTSDYCWDILLPTECDGNRVIEIYAEVTTNIFFNILGYWS